MENITIDKNQEQAKQPGEEFKMNPEPLTIRESYIGCNKLKNKVVLITGGDSGIGKSVAVHFAREGALVAIVFLNEDKDALQTKTEIENEGGQCLLLKGDVKDELFCKKAIDETISNLGSLNCVINNAAMQFPSEHIENIKTENLHTF